METHLLQEPWDDDGNFEWEPSPSPELHTMESAAENFSQNIHDEIGFMDQLTDFLPSQRNIKIFKPIFLSPYQFNVSIHPSSL
jgi:hypothetical protein